MISHKNDFVQGQGVYASLWEVDENLSGNFVLSSKYHRFKQKMVRGHEITTRVLEVKKVRKDLDPDADPTHPAELVTGRLITSQGTKCLCEIKKALAFSKEHLDSDGNPLKSGETPETVMDKILQSMWEESQKTPPKNADDDSSTKSKSPAKKKQKVQTKTAETDDDDDAAAANAEVDVSVILDADVCTVISDGDVTVSLERPANWIFQGFMAFSYFGPFAENRDAGRYIDLLLLCDPPKEKKKEMSRASQRKEAKKGEAFLRERDANRGGKSVVERILIANQETQLKKLEANKLEVVLLSLSMRANRYERAMGRALELANISKDFSKYEELEQKLEDVECEMKEMERMMKDGEVATTADTGDEDGSTTH